MCSVDWVAVPVFSILVFSDFAKSALPQAHQEGVLRPYKSYADVTLFHYYVPPEANVATFEFAAFMDDPKCSVREAFIYIQHGSYPVAAFDNSTFPKNFFVNRTALQRVVVRSSYNTHDASVLPIYNPLPGNWFAAAYLNTWDQPVQQEGLGHKCRYSLGSVGLWSLTSDVNTIPLKSTMRLKTSKHFTYYKFYIPSGVVSFTLQISDCHFLTSRWFRENDLAEDDAVSGGKHEVACIHNIFLRDRALPFYKSNQSNTMITSNENSSYIHDEKLPHTDVYYYLLIVSETKVTYNITILVEECPVITLSKSLYQQFSGTINTDANTSMKEQIVHVNMSIVSNFNKSASHVNEIVTDNLILSSHQNQMEHNNCPCIPTFRLTRIRHAQDFSDTFLLEGKDWYTSWLALTDSNPFAPVVGTSFELLPFIDIGGTLSISVHLDELLMNATTQTIQVNICLLQGRRPRTYCCDSDNITSCCDAGFNLQVSSKNLSQINAVRYIPFPEADVYFMSFKMHCESNGTVVPCSLPEALISLDIRTQPCVLGKQSESGISPCGSMGYCQEVHKSQYFYTACRCVAGYKGWSCNDDSEAIPNNVLLMTTLLLTLSNIFFIPAIILALTRRMFVQALIYSCTCISSTLYHACDQEMYGYCFTRYSVLQFCDFFCSILAFWVTIIAIAHSPPEYDSVLYMFGAVLISIGVEYNRTGLLVFVVPFVMGFFYVVSVWMFRSFQRGAIIFPKVGRLLIFIPGLLLGASGLILFAFVETEDNYRYTHSAWHTIIAISLLYLLPKRKSVKMQMLSSNTSNSSVAEMAHVNSGYQQPASASPVFFITSELDHLVQVQDRPQ